MAQFSGGSEESPQLAVCILKRPVRERAPGDDHEMRAVAARNELGAQASIRFPKKPARAIAPRRRADLAAAHEPDAAIGARIAKNEEDEALPMMGFPLLIDAAKREATLQPFGSRQSLARGGTGRGAAERLAVFHDVDPGAGVYGILAATTSRPKR